MALRPPENLCGKPVLNQFLRLNLSRQNMFVQTSQEQSETKSMKTRCCRQHGVLTRKIQ